MLSDGLRCQMVGIWGGSQIQGVVLGVWIEVVELGKERHVFSDVLELCPISVCGFVVDFYAGPIEFIYVFQRFERCCLVCLCFGHWE